MQTTFADTLKDQEINGDISKVKNSDVENAQYCKYYADNEFQGGGLACVNTKGCERPKMADGWDKKLSSLKVPHGYMMTIYEEENYKGWAMSFPEGEWDSVKWWNDRTSSYKCMPISNKFEMFIASDPQVPWGLECSEEKNNCKKLIEADRDKAINSVNSLIDIINSKQTNANAGLIINGDLTAFGHDDQLEDWRNLVKKINMPVFQGLGNHDYQNNLNDCISGRGEISWLWGKDGCAISMVKYIEAQTNDIPTIKNIHGESMSYSFGMPNGYLFVQLNNYSSFSATLHRDNNPFKDDVWKEIESSKAWLTTLLTNERNGLNRKVIINVHDLCGGEKWSTCKDNKGQVAIQNAIDKSKSRVVGIFAGHFHPKLGDYSEKFKVKDTNDYVVYGHGEVPVFLSGAMNVDKESFLKVSFEELNYTVEWFIKSKQTGSKSVTIRIKGK